MQTEEAGQVTGSSARVGQVPAGCRERMRGLGEWGLKRASFYQYSSVNLSRDTVNISLKMK